MNKEKALKITIAILAVATLGLAIALINARLEIDKDNLIMETSCKYTNSYSSCKKGMKIVKDMSIDEIKKNY